MGGAGRHDDDEEGESARGAHGEWRWCAPPTYAHIPKQSAPLDPPAAAARRSRSSCPARGRAALALRRRLRPSAAARQGAAADTIAAALLLRRRLQTHERGPPCKAAASVARACAQRRGVRGRPAARAPVPRVAAATRTCCPPAVPPLTLALLLLLLRSCCCCWWVAQARRGVSRLPPLYACGRRAGSGSLPSFSRSGRICRGGNRARKQPVAAASTQCVRRCPSLLPLPCPAARLPPAPSSSGACWCRARRRQP